MQGLKEAREGNARPNSRVFIMDLVRFKVRVDWRSNVSSCNNGKGLLDVQKLPKGCQVFIKQYLQAIK